jgi:hypothetical protein
MTAVTRHRAIYGFWSGRHAAQRHIGRGRCAEMDILVDVVERFYLYVTFHGPTVLQLFTTEEMAAS